jgi:lipopolysaccharide export system permease protein
MPLLTLLLAAMAVPMSRTPPRKGRFARSLAALVAFTIYYNLFSLGRTWVDQGHIPAMPGLWWVHLLPVLVVGYLVLSPGRALRAARRRAVPTAEG